MKEKRTYSLMSNLNFVYRHLWEFDKKIVGYQIAEMISQVLAGIALIALPAIMIQIIVGGSGVIQLILAVMGTFMGYGILQAITTFLDRRNNLQYIEFRAGYFLVKFAKKVMGMDYVQYEDEDIQKIINQAEERGMGQNNMGLEGMLHNFTRVMVALLSLLIFSLVLSKISFLIAGLLVLLSIAQYIAFSLASRYEFKNSMEKGSYLVSQQYLNRQAYDVAAGKDIRLYQLQDWLSKEYQRVNRAYQKLVAKERYGFFASDLMGLALQFVRDGVCYLYFMELLKQGMEVSEFVLYIGMIASFSAYFNEITRRLMDMERDQNGVEYIRRLFAIDPVFHHGTGTQLEDNQDALEIEFDQVSFSYPVTDGKQQKKVLDQISFTMKKGEKLALVGVNGAGKSTIIKLICGFYRPTEGTIRINGIDLKELDLDQYYPYLAVVFQEAFTTSFTIEENITCKEPAVREDAACIQALKEAGIWAKIETLEKKEKTHLNKDVQDDGIRLSGGQLQKLMLARAIYKNCRLLLLDEPTAALDAIAESEMYQEYHRILEGKTALFISHRLASTRFCDKIIFLEYGKICEEGTHEELMELGGHYREMFEIQSKYYREEAQDHAVEEYAS